MVCNIKAETQDLAALKGDIDSYSMVMDFVMMGRPEDPQYLITGRKREGESKQTPKPSSFNHRLPTLNPQP